jgi:hypothetical protein
MEEERGLVFHVADGACVELQESVCEHVLVWHV